MIFGGQNNSDNDANKGNIVTMDRFRSRTNVSPLRQAEAYWAALRSGNNIPSRSQIDPRGLENMLSQTFILERVAPGIARFRLAGQRVNELAGMEVRGMPITAFFTIEARKTVSAALENMFEQPAIIEMELQSEATRTRGSRTARMILLPLRSDLGDVSRALGVMVSEGGASRVSQRFTVNSCDIRPVQVDAKTQSQKPTKAPRAPHPVAPQATTAKGFSEEKPAFERRPGSLMDEARSLLNRAREESARPLKSEVVSAVRDAGIKTGGELVSRRPRNAKKSASHLRLVVSRD